MSIIHVGNGEYRQLGTAKVCSNHNQLEGVYRPTPNAMMTILLAERRKRWALAMQEKETRLSQFNGDSLIEPLFGAFGEKL